jgi:hypothetical protein
MDDIPDQVKTKLIPLAEVTDSKFFLWGIEDFRHGRPPAFDDGTTPRDWPTARVVVIGRCSVTANDIIAYERGRQFSVLMPKSMRLTTVRGRLSRRAVALFADAVGRGLIR